MKRNNKPLHEQCDALAEKIVRRLCSHHTRYGQMREIIRVADLIAKLVKDAYIQGSNNAVKGSSLD